MMNGKYKMWVIAIIAIFLLGNIITHFSVYSPEMLPLGVENILDPDFRDPLALQQEAMNFTQDYKRMAGRH